MFALKVIASRDVRQARYEVVHRELDLILRAEVVIRARTQIRRVRRECGHRLGTRLSEDSKLRTIVALKLILAEERLEILAKHIVLRNIEKVVASAHIVRFFGSQPREYNVPPAIARPVTKREEKFGVIEKRANFLA